MDWDVATQVTQQQLKLKEMGFDVMPHYSDARKVELTPAQKKAVMFAQQQILRAREARRVKQEYEARIQLLQKLDEEQAQLRLACRQEDSMKENTVVSLRWAIGHILRDLRTAEGKTLREVSQKAGVSLGYLSEVERGQKEASSELLSSIAESLGLSTAQMLRKVADYLDATASISEI